LVSQQAKASADSKMETTHSLAKQSQSLLLKSSVVSVATARSHDPLKELLPEPIFELGLKLFKTEDALRSVVENSVLGDLTYDGVTMSLRMNKEDDARRRMTEESTWFSYNLDTLGDSRGNDKEMLNMLDLGGNYGVISIAAYKKYSSHLRIVTVEPIPTTFFFLKWNLYLNGVPDIEGDSLDADAQKTGVIALNRGSAAVAGQDLHLCFNPASSMNSRVCDCKEGEANCVIVPSITVDRLAGMFDNQPIAMVKMDCEGCEFQSLPALAQMPVVARIRRLAGELHIPDKEIEEIACRWEHGRLMSKCQMKPGSTLWSDVECDKKLDCPN